MVVFIYSLIMTIGVPGSPGGRQPLGGRQPQGERLPLLGGGTPRRRIPVDLCVHLENDPNLERILRNDVLGYELSGHTTLTAFFQLCQDDPFARQLLYEEVPQHYYWSSHDGRFIQTPHWYYDFDFYGRLVYDHSFASESYYLKLLLSHVRGPVSFENLREYDGRICSTYREACQLRGLIGY